MLTYNSNLNSKLISIGALGDPNGEPKYGNSKPDTNILLIGNGFDIRAGIKSTFKDFIIFVVYGCILYNYENLYSLINSSISLSTIKKDKNKNSYPRQLKLQIKSSKQTYTECHKFAQSALGELIFKNIFSNAFCWEVLFTEYLEDASKSLPERRQHIASIPISYGISVASSENELNIPNDMQNQGILTIVYAFEKEIEKLNNRQDIELWLDVESIIEMIITRSEHLKNKYNFKDDICLDANKTQSFLDGLGLFEILLTKYLRRAQNIRLKPHQAMNYFNDIQNSFLSSLTKRSHNRIIGIDISKADIVVNYNYTNVAQRYFSEIDKTPKIIHINGSLDIPDEISLSEINTNIVIGYTKQGNIDLPKEAFPFEKTMRRIIKNTEYVDINSLIKSKTFDLVIMGHSCGIADSDIIGELLSSKNLKTAVILCHSLDDLISICNNIKQMVGESKFGELMAFSKSKITKNLYFAVEESS